MKYASGKIQNVPTSRTRSEAASFRLNVAANPSAIAVAGIAHGSATLIPVDHPESGIVAVEVHSPTA